MVAMLGTVVLGAAVGPAGVRAQHTDAHAPESGHTRHSNSAALFAGAATHLASEGHASETGFAVGVEYARRVSDLFWLGLIAEYASSHTERDYVAALPLYLHLARPLLLLAAPGVEFASIGDTGHEETETEFLVRLGAIYELTVDRLVIGPQVNVDWTERHWTLVYGVSLGIAF